MLSTNIKTVFISGCFDPLHGGHIQFINDAKKLGDYLVVCVPSDEVLLKYKNKKRFIPIDHQISILENLKSVDKVVVGGHVDNVGINFADVFFDLNIDILAVTSDDSFSKEKIEFCKKHGVKYVQLEKSIKKIKPISSSQILTNLITSRTSPLRVDFAGGWLDTEENKCEDGFIVNCAISPQVSLKDWPYEKMSGLGGSAAWASLNNKDSFEEERCGGSGWQDAAIIKETGCCVWDSMSIGKLVLKNNGAFLMGKMALMWTGKTHVTKDIRFIKRDYNLIKQSSQIAFSAIKLENIEILSRAVNKSYEAQLLEGMDALQDVETSIAKKYCGSGHGGYALYLFKTKEDRDKAINKKKTLLAVEPFLKNDFTSRNQL